MKLEILEEIENPLFDRRELKVRVLHKAATPSYADVRDKISVLAKAKKDTVILDSIKSRFGTRESIALVRIYKTKDRAVQIEPKHKLEKNFPKEEKKVEKPEEKPIVEGKVEAKKEEAKKEKTEEGQEKSGAKAEEVKEAGLVETKSKEGEAKSKVKSEETSKEMEEGK